MRQATICLLQITLQGRGGPAHRPDLLMKRKPTSYGDMLKTVARCNHPDLEPVHRCWLIALSLHADQNGGSAYPGYAALSEMTGRGFDRQRIYSNHCVKLGLVEIASQGRGKGIANVYRICLEHDAFPDEYNGRKTTSIEKGL